MKKLGNQNLKYMICHNEKYEVNKKEPKTVSIMLDLDGTCDCITEEKARVFINQLLLIKEKFGAEMATISISTHSSNPDKIKEVLDVLASCLCDNIKIGTCFYYRGTYDYYKDECCLKDELFNIDKVETFCDYYVNCSNLSNQWFGIIDDGINENVYKKFQKKRVMLVGKPTQNWFELDNNNFMSIATKTKYFDGVIEILDTYLNSIKDLTPLQILDRQKNMINKLKCTDLMSIIIAKDFVFLERYFYEKLADNNDYDAVLAWISFCTDFDELSKEELILLGNVLDLIKQYYIGNGCVHEVQEIVKLKKGLKVK